MRTVITWASSGINGDRTPYTTFIVDFDSESVVSCNTLSLLWLRNGRTAGSPVDVIRLVGRPRRMGAKQANARSGQWKLGNLPVAQASAGLLRLGSLEFPFNFLNAAAGVCVDPVGVSSGEDGGVLVGCEGVIIDHRTEVWRLGVSHDPTLITIGG